MRQIPFAGRVWAVSDFPESGPPVASVTVRSALPRFLFAVIFDPVCGLYGTSRSLLSISASLLFSQEGGFVHGIGDVNHDHVVGTEHFGALGGFDPFSGAS
jgi:hypothetical protein